VHGNSSNNNNNNNASATEILSETSQREEFLPETGLARQRMKQYLETSSSTGYGGGGQFAFSSTSAMNGSAATAAGTESELPELQGLQGKHIAKSLLAKWKSMENVKEKDVVHSTNGGGDSSAVSNGHGHSSTMSSRNSLSRTRAISKDRHYLGSNASSTTTPYVYHSSTHHLHSSSSSTTATTTTTAPPPVSASSSVSNEEQLPQAGIARTLLNKWQNIDASASSACGRERRGPRPITPPPVEEIERMKVR
jgi:hypothetical protein